MMWLGHNRKGEQVNPWDQDVDDDADDPAETDPKDQSGGFKKLRAAYNKQSKELAELKEANAKLASAQRVTTVSDVLKAKGVNPKVAKLVPADIEPTEDGVKQWLDEYADALNIKVPDSKDEQGEGDDAGDRDLSTLTAEETDAIRAISSTQASALTPKRGNELLAKLNDPSLTREQLEALIVAEGGGSVS